MVKDVADHVMQSYLLAVYLTGSFTLCSTHYSVVRPTNRTKRNNQVRLVRLARVRTINNSRRWELGALTLGAEAQMHFRLKLPSLLAVVRLELLRPQLLDPLFSVNRNHKGASHMCSIPIHR